MGDSEWHPTVYINMLCMLTTKKLLYLANMPCTEGGFIMASVNVVLFLRLI